MTHNPYNQDRTPRTHAGAQALINHLTNDTNPIPRPIAQQLIQDTNLSERTADNIILKLDRHRVITINGRLPRGSGTDNRANHTITRGPWWDR